MSAVDEPHLYPAQDMAKLVGTHDFVVGTSLSESGQVQKDLSEHFLRVLLSHGV